MPSQIFEYSGSQQTWTVPSGVSKVTVECWGAQGGDKGSRGGLGGYTKAEVSVSEGDTFYIYVGGQGSGFQSGGWPNGGDGGYGQDPDYAGTEAEGAGGGGSSDVRLNGDSRSEIIVLAGGGGGSGGAYYSSDKTGWGGDGGANALEGQLYGQYSNPDGGGASGFRGQDGSHDDDRSGGVASGGGGGGMNGGAAVSPDADQDPRQAPGGGGGDGAVSSPASLLESSVGENGGDGEVRISYPDNSSKLKYWDGSQWVDAASVNRI